MNDAEQLWDLVLGELRERRPQLAAFGERASAQFLDEHTLTVRAPGLVAAFLAKEAPKTEVEILLSSLTNHQVMELDVIAYPL